MYREEKEEVILHPAWNAGPWIPTHVVLVQFRNFRGRPGLNVNTGIMLIFRQRSGHRDIRHPPQAAAAAAVAVAAALCPVSAADGHDYANVRRWSTPGSTVFESLILRFPLSLVLSLSVSLSLFRCGFVVLEAYPRSRIFTDFKDSAGRYLDLFLMQIVKRRERGGDSY